MRSFSWSRVIGSRGSSSWSTQEGACWTRKLSRKDQRGGTIPSRVTLTTRQLRSSESTSTLPLRAPYFSSHPLQIAKSSEPLNSGLRRQSIRRVGRKIRSAAHLDPGDDQHRVRVQAQCLGGDRVLGQGPGGRLSLGLGPVHRALEAPEAGRHAPARPADRLRFASGVRPQVGAGFMPGSVPKRAIVHEQ